VDVQREPGGGATLRCSQQELVRFYNSLNQLLNESTPAEDEEFPQVMRELRLQLHQLAVLVGMEKYHPHPDE
jgi:hypothetical protein